jgi:hypothetical protein
MLWIKGQPDRKNPGERWTCSVPPDGSHTLTLFAKGDGRWGWECHAAGAERPMAYGIVGSLAAAKTVSVNFLKRAGQI